MNGNVDDMSPLLSARSNAFRQFESVGWPVVTIRALHLEPWKLRQFVCRCARCRIGARNATILVAVFNPGNGPSFGVCRSVCERDAWSEMGGVNRPRLSSSEPYVSLCWPRPL
jgi:hypothetical protein